MSKPSILDDEATFTSAAQRHRRELHVHCYRMLGSFDDAEDAVQETFLRGWKYRASLQDGAPLRPWLYRIATNVCLDLAKGEGRRNGTPRPGGDEQGAGSASTPQSGGDAPTRPSEVLWLQPYPDTLLEAAAPRDAEPDARIVTKETIELAFLATIQLLTPGQRAAIILRDILGWSAKETAELLEITPAAVNSSLQRARATLRERLPSPAPEWPAGADPTRAERELLRRYVETTEQADVEGLASLIREDAVFRMPPEPGIWVGRDVMVRSWVEGGFGSPKLGPFRCIVTRANRQPAVACYHRPPGSTRYRRLAMDVLRIEDGMITEIVTFPGDVFGHFGLPEELDGEGRIP